MKIGSTIAITALLLTTFTSAKGPLKANPKLANLRMKSPVQEKIT